MLVSEALDGVFAAKGIVPILMVPLWMEKPAPFGAVFCFGFQAFCFGRENTWVADFYTQSRFVHRVPL